MEAFMKGLSNCGFTNKAYLVKVMMDVIYE